MRILAALALLVSVNAYACPDLTGSFTCTYQDNTSEVVTISQENKDGVMVYNYNGSAIPADNQAYQVPDDQNLKEGTFRAWCDPSTDTVLNTELIGKYYQDGSYFGDLNLDMTFALDGANLKQVSKGTLTNQSDTYPLDGELTCTRNP